MDLVGTFRRSGGIDAIARQLDDNNGAVRKAIDVLLPALVEGLRGHVARGGGGRTGFDALLALINRFGDGSLAAQVMGPYPPDSKQGVALGSAIYGLSEIEWLAKVSALADEHVGPDILLRTMPLLVMLVCGYITALAAGGSASATASGLDDWFALLTDGG